MKGFSSRVRQYPLLRVDESLAWVLSFLPPLGNVHLLSRRAPDEKFPCWPGCAADGSCSSLPAPINQVTAPACQQSLASHLSPSPKSNIPGRQALLQLETQPRSRERPLPSLQVKRILHLLHVPLINPVETSKLPGTEHSASLGGRN